MFHRNMSRLLLLALAVLTVSLAGLAYTGSAQALCRTDYCEGDGEYVPPPPPPNVGLCATAPPAGKTCVDSGS
jgi:hypothetical protein